MTITFLSESASGTTIISDQAYHLSKGRIWIRGEITEELAGNVASELMWCEDKDLPVTIYIDSVGGDVVAGLSIIDLMTAAKVPIDVVCVGKAYSMGAIILACGAGEGHRHILPHAKVMLHQPYTGGVGGTASNIRERADALLNAQNTLIDLISAHTGHTKKMVEKDMNYDHYFSAEEAVKYGLVDDIWEKK